MTDILVVQQRIINLCLLIDLPAPLLATKAVANEEDCSFADTALPVFVVVRGPGREFAISADMFQSNREYLLKLYVAEICNPTASNDNEPEAALAASCIVPTLEFFSGRRGLELNDTGIVAAQTIAQDTPAARRYTHNNKVYSGALFRMQITTRHVAEGV